MMLKYCSAVILWALLFQPFAYSENLQYHAIQTDAQGKIIPWYSPDLGVSYDHDIRLVWNFWKNLEKCPNGVPYFLQHLVWKPDHDKRALGGDQLAMALSSLHLLWGYLGEKEIVDYMQFIADYYINNGFSAPDCAWPNLPYPYNTDVHSGKYDGDMKAGKGVLQPDKAASFGAELITLYKSTGEDLYLNTAVKIADTLAAKIQPGDKDHSPWPFRVIAKDGGVPTETFTPYTANWTGALRLFEELIQLNKGDVEHCKKAFAITSEWLKKYPLQNNNWGPFFEDVPEYSNTEINADTMAWFILEHPEWDAAGKEKARAILDWSQKTFGNPTWEKYGVFPVNEQTTYMVPGNSHTSRHASVELRYAELTGDNHNKDQAVLQLNWATYMVDFDGKNRFFHSDTWLTDGYGDYIRHYLRAMASLPELAPKAENHLLRSSSVISEIHYTADTIAYKTWDKDSRELLRIDFEIEKVLADGVDLPRFEKVADLEKKDGYTYNAPGDTEGVLRIHHSKVKKIEVVRKNPILYDK